MRYFGVLEKLRMCPEMSWNFVVVKAWEPWQDTKQTCSTEPTKLHLNSSDHPVNQGSKSGGSGVPGATEITVGQLTDETGGPVGTPPPPLIPTHICAVSGGQIIILFHQQVSHSIDLKCMTATSGDGPLDNISIWLILQETLNTWLLQITAIQYFTWWDDCS